MPGARVIARRRILGHRIAQPHPLAVAELSGVLSGTGLKRVSLRYHRTQAGRQTQEAILTTKSSKICVARRRLQLEFHAEVSRTGRADRVVGCQPAKVRLEGRLRIRADRETGGISNSPQGDRCVAQTSRPPALTVDVQRTRKLVATAEHHERSTNIGPQIARQEEEPPLPLLVVANQRAVWTVNGPFVVDGPDYSHSACLSARALDGREAREQCWPPGWRCRVPRLLAANRRARVAQRRLRGGAETRHLSSADGIGWLSELAFHSTAGSARPRGIAGQNRRYATDRHLHDHQLLVGWLQRWDSLFGCRVGRTWSRKRPIGSVSARVASSARRARGAWGSSREIAADGALIETAEGLGKHYSGTLH